MAGDELVQPIAVEPREGYRIWIRYADGPEDEIDLSDLSCAPTLSICNSLE